MDKRNSMAGGVILILLGLFFLVDQFMPGLFDRILGGWFSWPIIIVGVGLIFLISAFAGRTGPLAIPGCIVGGIGLILAYQNATGNWESWSYAWALIPAFVGLGIFTSGLISPENRPERRSGLGLMIGGLTGFLILGGLYNFNLDKFWPVLLICAGVYLLAKTVLNSRSRL